MPVANSLAQASQVIGGVVGAGIAGVIFGTFGSGVAGFAIDSATFLLSFLLVLRISPAAGQIRAGDKAAAASQSVRAGVLEGLSIVRHSRVLSGIIIALGVTMLGLGAVNVLFVPLIVEDLQVSPTWMAGIEGAQVVGMLAAAGLVTALVRRLAPTTIISVGLAGVGVGIGLMAGVSAVWQVMAILLAVGLFVTPLQAMAQTLVQTSTEDATRGRVVALLQAAMSTASVASMAIGGLLADVVGVRSVYVLAGVMTVAAAGLSWVMFRGTRATPAERAGIPVTDAAP